MSKEGRINDCCDEVVFPPHPHQRQKDDVSPENTSSKKQGEGLSPQTGQLESVENLLRNLLSKLLDSDWRARLDVAEYATLLDQKTLSHLLQQLGRALNDRSVAIRIAAVEGLSRLGGEAHIDLFLQALSDDDWQVRTLAVRALGALGKDAPLQVLIGALKDTDMSVRDTAIWTLKPFILWALRDLKDSAPLEAVLEALNDESEMVRISAIEVIGELEEQVPIEELLRLLEDPNEHELVRSTTLQVLGQLGEQVPIENLILALKDSQSSVRTQAESVLGDLYEEVYQRASTEFLLSLLDDESDSVRALATWALGERKEYAAISHIIASLQDPNDFVRMTASWSLKRFSNHMSLETGEEENLHSQQWSPAKDLLSSLVHFMKEKRGYVVAESRQGSILVLKLYYQIEEDSVKETVLKPRLTYTHVDHLERALKDRDEIIQDLAKQMLKRRERRPWMETFIVSLDLLSDSELVVQSSLPMRVVVCSIGYHQVRKDDVSIHESLNRYVDHYKDHSSYCQLSDWVAACDRSVFGAIEGVRGMKMWYDSIDAPASACIQSVRENRYYQDFAL